MLLLAKPTQPPLHQVFEMCEGPRNGRLCAPDLLRTGIDDIGKLDRASSLVVLHAQVWLKTREVRDTPNQNDVHRGGNEESFGIWRSRDLPYEIAHRFERRALEAV